MNARAFDHQHSAWSELLAKHVQWSADGHASSVDYAGFANDQAALDAYLADLSGISQSVYDRWSEPEQLAFLINAYNAFTVSLVLTRYPRLTSIKDIGSIFRSPWKKTFFTLLDEERHLDDVEHGLIREPGVFDDARIHFAVNCASIGCPALRDEAFVAEQLDQQLDDQVRRFVADASRNYAEADRNIIHISSIFDWYGDDFSLPPYESVVDFLRRYQDSVSDDVRAVLNSDRPRIRYSDYDWSLNQVQPDA